MGSSSLDVRENKNEWVEGNVDCPGRKQRVLITNDFYERNYNIKKKKKKAVDQLPQTENLIYIILFTWASRVILGFNGPILLFPCSENSISLPVKQNGIQQNPEGPEYRTK